MRGIPPTFAEFVQMKAQEAANQAATLQRPSTALAAPALASRYGNDEASLMGQPMMRAVQTANEQYPVMPDYSNPAIYVGDSATFRDQPATARGMTAPLDTTVRNTPSLFQTPIPNFTMPGSVRVFDVAGDNVPSAVADASKGLATGSVDLAFDPEYEYKNLVANGVDPVTARSIVDEEVARRAEWAPVDAGLAASAEVAAANGSPLLRKGIGFLSEVSGIADKPLYGVREDQAGKAYESFQLLENWNYDTDYARYWAREYAGKEAWGSQEEWDQFRRDRIIANSQSMRGVLGMPNDPLGVSGGQEYLNVPTEELTIGLPEYDKLNPAEKAEFRRGLIDAYDNGFAPQKRVLTDVGVYVDQPTGEFFEPGARAAWEYIAGQQGTTARVVETLTNDPLNAPFGAFNMVGRGFIREGAEQAARAGAERAVREAGEVVLREGEEVISTQAGRAWVKTPNLRPGERFSHVDDAGNYVIIQTGPGGAEEAITRAPVYTSRRSGEWTIGDTINSWVNSAAGGVRTGVGIGLQTPDAVLNYIPDVMIEGAFSNSRFFMSELPVIGKLFQDELKTKGIRTLHESKDAIGAARDTRMFDRTDLGSPMEGPAPTSIPPEPPIMGTGGVVGEDFPGPFPDQPSAPSAGPRMPNGRPGFDTNLTINESVVPSAPVDATPSITMRTLNGIEYAYLGDGNAVRIAPVEGEFQVQQWNGTAWDAADVPMQPDMESAVALASELTPIARREATTPNAPRGLLDTDPNYVDMGDNPNLPRVTKRETARQPTLTVAPQPTAADEVVQDATPNWVEKETPYDSPAVTADTFDVESAWPQGDPSLPDAFGPHSGRSELALDAAMRGYENPVAGNKFFDRYRKIVGDFIQRDRKLSADIKARGLSDAQWDEFTNAKAFYATKGMHYQTPDSMGLNVEMMGEAMRAYREEFGEAPEYVFRYGDDIAINSPGPIPTNSNGGDLDMGVSITYDPDNDMAPRYAITWAGDEWWTTNIDNVIERAAFDPDEEIAGAARRFLRVVGKQDPRMREAERLASIARVESGIGTTSRGSIGYSRKRVDAAGGSWRTLAEGQDIPKGYDVRTNAAGKTQIYVPAKGKGSKPRVTFEQGRELDDGTVLMHSGFGGIGDESPTPTRFRHIGLKSWRPDPSAFPTGPIEGPTAPIMPQPRPVVDSKSNAILDTAFTGGVHDKMTLRQVHDHYWKMAERDQAELADLKRMGGDADMVDARTRREIGGKLRKNQYATDPALFPDDDLSKLPSSVRMGKRELSQEVHERVAYLEAKWSRYGDLNAGDAYELAAGRAAWEHALSIAPKLTQERKLFFDMLHALFYRLPRTLLLADPITSWTYVMRNMISNTQMTGIYDIGAVTSRANWGNFAKNAVGSENSVVAQMYDTLFGSPMPDQFRQSAGLLEEVTDTPTAQAITSVAAKTKKIGGGPKAPSTPTRRALEQIGLGFTTNAGRPFDWMRNVTRNLERSSKLGAMVPMLNANLGEAIYDVADQASLAAWRMGVGDINADEIAAMMMAIRDGNGVFSRDQLYSAMFYRSRQMGATDDLAGRYADRVTRDWIEAARRASDKTIAELNHIFPNALNQTNLDHYLSYVTLFHFWPTRAMVFMAEEMIRNPRLIVNWYRAHEGFERMAEEGEYPESVKGLIRLWKSPLGFSLYSNPAALFLVTALLPTQAERGETNGVTWFGSILQSLREKTGLAPIPMLEATLSLVGIYGDNYMPDIIPSRTYDLATAALDYALTSSGHRPHTPFWDQKMLELREMVTSAVPGVSTIEAGNAGGYARDMVGSMILEQNPDLARRMTAIGPDGRPTADAVAAKQEYLAIIENPSDPRYREAESAVYRGGLWTRMVNLVFPFSTRSVLDSRAEAVQLNKEEDAAMEAGLTPTEGQRRGGVLRGTVSNTPEAQRLETQRAADLAFGSEEDRLLHRVWTNIAFPDQASDEMVYISPTQFIPVVQLRGMSQEARYDLADQVIADMGKTEQYELFKEGRDNLRATMPEFQAYEDWKDWMREQPGEIAGARVLLMEWSPGYRSYIDGLDPSFKEDPETFDRMSTSVDAYLAAQGKPGSVYAGDPGDATDISNIPAYMLVGGGESSSKSGGSSTSKADTAATRLERLNKDIREYDAAMEKFNAKVREITGGALYEDLAPMWQESLKRRLEREGIKVPSKPSTVANYEEYLELNPEGTPMTYIEWTIENDV